MSAADLATAILLALGCFIALSAALGVLRLPDFFTRMHASGKNDSLAQLLILAALMIQAGLSMVTVKLVLIFLFLWFTTPSSTYAVARAAYLDGRNPWRKPGSEDEGKKQENAPC